MALLLVILCSLLLLLSYYSSSSGEIRTFIVQVNRDAKPSVFSTHKNWYESSLASLCSVQRVHIYDTVFHGFSAKLLSSVMQKLKKLPHIVSIIPEQVRHPQTTHSPAFLGLRTTESAGLLKESDFGSDLAIGVIDTGIWLERQSFNDRDLGPIPMKWKGRCVPRKDFPVPIEFSNAMGERRRWSPPFWSEKH